MHIIEPKQFSIGRYVKMDVPPKDDPRYLLLIFFAIYASYIYADIGSIKGLPQYFTVVAVCLFTDLFLQLILYKKISVFPLSSFISAHGVFFIIYSTYLWVYALIAFLTILSKFFLKWKNHHIFNPNNIAIVTCLIFLDEYVTTSGGMWKGQDIIQLIIMLFGFFIAKKCNRHYLVLSFALSFLIFGLIQSYFLYNTIVWLYFYPILGPAFSIYLFYMITDPQTSPRNRKIQILAGISLAVFDAFFRYKEQKYSLIFASTCNVALIFLCTQLSGFLKVNFLKKNI